MGTHCVSLTRSVAIIGSLLLAVAAIHPAMALDDGSYMFQCSCPITWGERWIGSGELHTRESRDNLILSNDTTVVIIQEVPLDDYELSDMTDFRAETLERSASIDDLEERWQDDTSDDVITTGYQWTNAEGDLVYDYNHVMPWEGDWVMSIDVIAPASDYADAFDEVHTITLVLSPLLEDVDGAEIADLFDAAS